MNVRPLTVESIIRSKRRDRPLLSGWLMESLIETAYRLAPGLVPFPERGRLMNEPLPTVEPEEPKPKQPPRWMQWLNGGDGQGLAEYALILALIAVVAIIAVLFLGTQISSILSQVGNSIPPP